MGMEVFDDDEAHFSSAVRGNSATVRESAGGATQTGTRRRGPAQTRLKAGVRQRPAAHIHLARHCSQKLGPALGDELELLLT
jgi:hypothetical protein